MKDIMVSREVDVAIKGYMEMITASGKIDRETGAGIFVAEHCQQDWRNYEDGQYAALNDISTYDLMVALVYGYDVEERHKMYHMMIEPHKQTDAMAILSIHGKIVHCILLQDDTLPCSIIWEGSILGVNTLKRHGIEAVELPIV